MSNDPWKHRARGMRCATCMWYVPKVALSNEAVATRESDVVEPPREIGRCRKHAPTMSGFPAVFPADWCGDHRLDETKMGA